MTHFTDVNHPHCTQIRHFVGQVTGLYLSGILVYATRVFGARVGRAPIAVAVVIAIAASA